MKKIILLFMLVVSVVFSKDTVYSCVVEDVSLNKEYRSFVNTVLEAHKIKRDNLFATQYGNLKETFIHSDDGKSIIYLSDGKKTHLRFGKELKDGAKLYGSKEGIGLIFFKKSVKLAIGGNMKRTFHRLIPNFALKGLAIDYFCVQNSK